MGSTPSISKAPAKGTLRDLLSKETLRTVDLAKRREELVKIMLPVYYLDDEVTHAELEIAKENWNCISFDSTEVYQLKRSDPNFTYNSAMDYFITLFYTRLFDVHPVSRDLFKNMTGQGQFLKRLVALAFSEKADPQKFQLALIRLAEVHNQRGVKAVECKFFEYESFLFVLYLFSDGIVGEVLFWALRRSIGLAHFTMEMHVAWVKLYCRMLKVMVPLAVAFELENGEKQQQRYWGHTIGMTKEEEETVLATTTVHTATGLNLFGGK